VEASDLTLTTGLGHLTMALRPAGKTLSSLTGILVVAAVLWLILNFVYAPSCGRLACGPGLRPPEIQPAEDRRQTG
jgi:hypothetical protein